MISVPHKFSNGVDTRVAALNQHSSLDPREDSLNRDGCASGHDKPNHNITTLLQLSSSVSSLQFHSESVTLLDGTGEACVEHWGLVLSSLI